MRELMTDKDKDNLIQAIEAEDVEGTIKATCHILAKDDKACMEIAEAYLAVDEECRNDKENRK